MSPTILCFKEHSSDGLVWWVRHRGKWKTAWSVVVSAPFRTVYRGKSGRQPHAFCEFIGTVKVEGRDKGKCLTISPTEDPMMKRLMALDRFYSTPLCPPVLPSVFKKSRARREAR